MRLIDADALIEVLYREKRNALMQDHNSVARGIQASINCISNIPTIEPKRGEWEEKETFHNADDNPIIEEWQSARCSVCHKYHTTPYMYYFNDYNFCPNCGADMREREGE